MIYVLCVQAFTQDKTPLDMAQPALVSILSNLPSAPAGETPEGSEARLDEETRLVAAAVKWAQK